MITKQWLIINKRGITRMTRTKPSLGYNEIAIAVQLQVPDELFERPVINAKIEIKDVDKLEFDPQVIIDTKELVEQQTGAKIEFTVVHETK